jgi:hypothetical protein
MHHNRVNNSGVMVFEGCRWLLEILIWTEWRDLVTSEFGLNQSEIEGNSEYQSHRGLHKLCKEGQNAGLWYRTKKLWGDGVGRNLKIWLRIGIIFFLSFLCFSRFASWCKWMYDNMQYVGPIHSSPKEKLTKYRWRTYSRWQSRTHPRS